jgi:UDP-N-acetyl-D-glucosamine dehydrogenase
MKQQLIDQLRSKTAVIGVVGLGYVGLPLALRFAEVGFRVIGFDIDRSKVDALGRGRSYFRHIASESVARAVQQGFTASDDFSGIAEVQAVIICVPTPLDEHREPDLSYVIGTIETIRPYLRPGQVISLESTTYPGTTEEEIKPRVEAAGLRVGQDAFVVFSPEREDPGNPRYTTHTIPKICGGITPACLEVGLALYGAAIDQVVPVSSTRVAEMAKLLENIHRAVNIGLANEMKVVCDRMGIDIYEVIRAAATKPFGFVPYYPGPGLGGHCIPIDPFYLTWKAREYGVHARFIELAGEINGAMPAWVVQKIAEALNTRSQSLKGSKILILGIAYKKNVDDVRESPAAEIMRLLAEKGAIPAYSDPYVPRFPKMRRYRFDLASTPLDPAGLSAHDCVVIVTDHEAFDYDLIKQHSRLIVDARGVFHEPAAHIFRA